MKQYGCLALVLAIAILSPDPFAVRATTDAPAIDVQTRQLERIAPGTVIGEGPPKGWSHLVEFVRPRLGAGDVDAVPAIAVRYSTMFHLAIVANVAADRETNNELRYRLDRVAIGFAINQNNQNVITTSKHTNLGLIGQSVFEENEKCIADFVQVARTRTMLVFDAKAILLRGNEHQYMYIRHAFVVTPAGNLLTFVWLLGSERNGTSVLAEDVLQLLPPNLQEDRVISVKREKFTFGIPSQDAFALVRIPQGTPIRHTAELKAVGAQKPLTVEGVQRLETELQRVAQYLKR